MDSDPTAPKVSLTEKIKAQKAAEAAQKAEAERLEKEKEEAGLRQEFEAILNRRGALAEIKEASAAALEKLGTAKKSLRKSRKELRDVYELSKDEESGEAAIPKPADIIKDQEYQGEVEVIQYDQAREEFRLSAEQVRNLHTQLKELGIEEPEKLLPGQLEIILADTDRELSAQITEFLQEHPDVDPEKAAEIRVEIVNTKSEAIRNDFFLSSFNSKLGTARQFVVDLPGDIDGVKRRIGNLLGSIDSEDRAHLIRNFFKEGRSVDLITDVDIEAMQKAIASMLIPDLEVRGTLAPAIIQSWKVRKETDKKFPKIDSQTPDEAKTYEDAKKAYFNERVRSIGAEIQEAVETSPVLERVARRIIEDYKMMRSIKDIENAIKQLEKNKREVPDKLQEFTNNINTANAEVRDKEREIERLDALAKRLLEAKTGLIGIERTLNSYLDKKISIQRDSWGGGIGIEIQGANLTDAEFNERFPNKGGEYDNRIKDIKTLKGNILNAKKGILGTTSGEKKAATAALKRKLEEIYPGSSFEGTVEEADARIQHEETEKSTHFKINDGAWQTHSNNKKRVGELLKPLENCIAVLNIQNANANNLSELISLLQNKVTEKITEVQTDSRKAGEAKSELEVKLGLLRREARSVEQSPAQITRNIEQEQEERGRTVRELDDRGYKGKGLY